MRTIILPIACLSALAWAQQPSSGQGTPPAPLIRENATVKLTEHVWAIPDFNVGLVPNVGIIVGSKATLVVDTGLGPKNGETIVREMKKVSSNADVYVVLTHYHPEHSLGAAAFKGATLLMTRIQQQDMTELGKQIQGTFADRSAVTAELLNGVAYPTPDILFDREYRLDLGGVHARLLWRGPSAMHTRGDTMILVEEDRVLFTGDVVMSQRFLAAQNNSSITTWLSTLDELTSLGPSKVVPSHGSIGDATLIARDREFLHAVQTRVGELKRAGKSSDEAVAAVVAEIAPKYPEWGNPSGAAAAARAAYAEAHVADQPPAVQMKNAPEIPFDSVPNFLKLPDGMNFGEVPGVAVNSKGHIFVFTRSNSAYGPAYGAAAAQLLEFGPTGAFVREVGKQLYGWSFAHSVRIDKNDNIWAIDKGSDMVIKFSEAGRVQWVFGRRQESADEAKPWEHVNPPLPARDGLFRQPTDVGWDSKGNIYITDGYINSRVAKYDRNGDWVTQWGTKGSRPGQFDTPHSIVIDGNDNVYVGDRGNRRVQVFDTDGNFLRQWTVDVAPDFNTRAVNGATPPRGSTQGIGAPNSLCIPPNQNAVMFLGESTWPGRVFKLALDGTVIGVIGKAGRNLKQFSGAHAIACPSENEIYVAESSNWRVQKINLRPTRSTASSR